MLKLYNTLTRKIEGFKPLHPPKVGMYTCGPTVYQFASIGNFRTYVTSDILRLVLTVNGYRVKAVMNITDVGHLTGDGDLGTDKIEAEAKLEKKTAWDIAKFYTEAFLQDAKKLNIQMPDVMPKATEHIEEQIQLIKELEKKGLTYETSDGIYFNTVRYEEVSGKKYGMLSTLDELKVSARKWILADKKDPRDFALWKFSVRTVHRQMKWKSPWGIGFPGWHIECSAMSMKYLDESFDIHVGGEDLRQTHHPNEVAQSEGATGKKFVNYWVHTTFLLVDGKRMGKSEGNAYTISDVVKKGFDPLALRYLYLQTHYRQEMNFTWEALESAQNALNRLREAVSKFDNPKIGCAEFEQNFLEAINNDLNMPEALSVVWELVKSDYPTHAKAESLFKFDSVLGLNLAQAQSAKRKVQNKEIPEEVMELVREREELRKKKRFHLADQLRNKIKKLGYEIQDTNGETRVKKIGN